MVGGELSRFGGKLSPLRGVPMAHASDWRNDGEQAEGERTSVSRVEERRAAGGWRSVMSALQRDYSRRTFLRGGGAMIVGFSLAGAGFGAHGASTAGADPYASNGPFDQQAIDSWITIHADNTATVKFGVVDMGQGTPTGLLMIAAEELGMGMGQVRHVTQDTNVTPDQGNTSASLGIERSGMEVRAAAAAARQALLELAAVNLGVAKASLAVSAGVVSGGGRSVSYGALLGGKLFNLRSGAAFSLASGAPGTRPISEYKIVGRPGVPRRDIPAKVTGAHTYVHSIRIPGMLHARVVRPRGQGGYGGGTAPKLLSVEERSIRHVAGARVVRYGDFLSVVADSEYGAIQAAAQLKAKWAEMPPLAGVGNIWKQMREFDSAGLAPARIGLNRGNFESAFAAAPLKFAGSFKYHYQGSMPVGPVCCVADVTPTGARVFSNTQHPHGTRQLVKEVLDRVLGSGALPLNRIRVTYYEGASVFGDVAPYNDAAQGAAIISALTGKPVRLQFMRWDEHGWGNYGPAQLTDVRGGVDASGKLVAFEFTSLGIPSHSTHAAQQQVTGAAQFSTSGPLIVKDGLQYNIPNHKLVGKSLPLKDNYFKVAPLRAPNAPQSTFASEQMIDQLAYLAKIDPVQFRRQNIASVATDPAQRWRNVLEAVARLSGWQPSVAASKLSSASVVSGRGMAFGHSLKTMPAAVVDIELNKKTGKIVIKNVYVALDAGFVVYPDGLHNNEEGAILHGIGRALHEQVVFDKKGVTSLDWVSYPVLRFKDAPKVTISVASRADVPMTDTTTVAANGSRSTGAAERGLEPISAAIANAFFDATGVRIHEAPMTPARVRAVLRAAGE
jgi:nicotinate dehydrogenase subunit B